MKRISFFLAVTLLAAPAVLRAQDAAVEERLNKLTAQIQDLVDAKDAQNKRIEELAKELRELQDQQGKPNASYASQEDLKQLADKLQEIDRKRQEDNDLILKRIEGLGKTLGSSARPAVAPRPATPPADAGTSTPSDKGYEYVIQSGDTLSIIVKAYAEKNIKVTVDQIVAANPGLNPKRLRVGQKVFIPAPQP
ncbi:MAG: LysM peptidoglycan-binding domain-containing protein [Verrucomicrobiota bacterium]|jgi:nucleoid-associated protein YgaU